MNYQKFREFRRKVFKFRLIVGGIMTLIVGGYVLFWHFTGGIVQIHMGNKPEHCITELSAAEQQALLQLFQVEIPETEEKAYVYCCSYEAGSDERIAGYTIEIARVRDYEGFYAANTSHGVTSFNETTSDKLRTDTHYYIRYSESLDTKMEAARYKKFRSLYEQIEQNHS